MSKQLLIYNTAVPVSRARHFDCSLEPSGNYAFSNGINSVPLMAIEFPEAASEYPIVFAGPDGDLTPAVVLGVRSDENLFLSSDGNWVAKYIPAFIRRYPFVFSKSEDRFLLCVGEEFAGFNREGRGQRFFEPDGQMSPYVANVLKFVQEYQAQYARTQAFCARVEELDLLEPMEAQVTIETGEKMRLAGFKSVSRAKLKALSGEKLAQLAATDELELLYLQLHSMNNFEALTARLEVAKLPAPNTAEPPPPEPPPPVVH